MTLSPEHPTVFPFIMRGIILQGVASSEASMTVRKEVWSKLANEWKPKNLEYLVDDCSLENLNSKIDKILDQLGVFHVKNNLISKIRSEL